MKYVIEIECDEWKLSDSLHEIHCSIENDDLLDQMTGGQVETYGDNFYSATIREV